MIYFIVFYFLYGFKGDHICADLHLLALPGSGDHGLKFLIHPDCDPRFAACVCGFDPWLSMSVTCFTLVPPLPSCKVDVLDNHLGGLMDGPSVWRVEGRWFNPCHVFVVTLPGAPGIKQGLVVSGSSY